MTKIKAIGQITIVDLNDAKQVQCVLESNQGDAQIYNPDTKKYTPDYTIPATKLILTPKVYVTGSSESQIAKCSNFKYTVNGTVYTVGATGDYAVSPAGVLSISKNITTSSLIIKFTCDYIDPETSQTTVLECHKTITKSSSAGALFQALITCPRGNIFDKATSGTSLTAEARAYRGGTQDKDGLQFTWSKLNIATGTWSPLTTGVANNPGAGTIHCIGYAEQLPNDTPRIGDTVVQQGSQTDRERQHIIMILAFGESAPALIEYAGINDYELDTHRVTTLSPHGNRLSAAHTEITNEMGITTPLTTYRGEWKEQTDYCHYDIVTYHGSTWMCNISKGTTTRVVPAENSNVWLKQISKGEQGESVYTVQLLTDKGNILRNGVGHITITARVMHGNQDITDKIAPESFAWRRISTNPEYDKHWNLRHTGVGKIITVNAEDVFNKAHFECEVDIE